VPCETNAQTITRRWNSGGRVKKRLNNAPRRSLSPPATRATAPSPSLLRATSTSTKRFSVPSRQNACLCPSDLLPPPPALESELAPVPIRAHRSCSTVTNAVVRCAYRESKCTAMWSPNRDGYNTCGDTLAKSVPAIANVCLLFYFVGPWQARENGSIHTVNDVLHYVYSARVYTLI
jgi:hypothetical protein